MNKIIFYCVSLLVIVKSATSQSGPVIKTPLGSVQGKLIKSYEGRTVSAFEGIPFAKPPVGDLRFKAPQPVEKWSTTLKADKTYICLQYFIGAPEPTIRGDEDCLYLYVYVPREKITGEENMDVVIHIHSGAFTSFDPHSVGGPAYIMDRDLIYVSLNYRLGILGFLSTQDEVVPGNNGLKDQVLAMKWVKDNIKYFGGNPNSITLTGDSAGGCSVHYHYLSPLSTGLFNRGLSQSGTVLNMWALSKDPVQKAQKLGQLFNCSLESSKSLVDCLRSKPVRDVVSAHRNFVQFVNTLPVTPFGPVIEFGPDAFLPDHPYKMLLEGRINDYPWITSNTKDEGTAIVGYFLSNNKLEELGNRWNELSPHTLDYNDTAYDFNKQAIAKLVKSHYLGDEPISYKNIDNLIRLFSDRYFQIDAIKAICLHSRVAHAPVYFYFYDYAIDAPVAHKTNLTVVSHGDDSRFLFYYADNPKKLSDSDRKMKDVFIDFIYRYASTGIPDFKGIPWEPVTSFVNPTSYMYIRSPTDIRIENGINLEPFFFWHNLPLLENENLFPYLLDVIQILTILY